MKVLVIGGGGREHALVWKLQQSAGVEKVWCVPGNGGISAEAECLAADAGNVPALVALAEKISPDLTVVGPELPLVNGLTDAFRQRKYAVVGPSQQAAQLEGVHVRLAVGVDVVLPYLHARLGLPSDLGEPIDRPVQRSQIEIHYSPPVLALPGR